MKIGYWIFNYMPQWEAASKEVSALHEHQSESALFALNTKHRRLGLAGRTRHIPLPWGLIGLPLLSSAAARFQLNHIFASAAERLLVPRIGSARTILTVTKDAPSLARVESNLPNLKKLGAVVVESEGHRELLLQGGIDESRLHLVYPGVAMHEYRPAEGEFRILFASSPPVPNDLLSRGVHLMLRVAARMPQVRFVMAWRKANIDALHALIREYGVENIDVHNGYIEDMDELYASTHASILPGLTHNSLKPCPHSALNALAHGKPVLASGPTSISALLEREACGVTFAPTIEGLESAIGTLMADYGRIQPNCHRAVESHFTLERFIQEYDQLYQTLSA